MLLKKWDDLPVFMKNDEVRKYYDVLSKKRVHLWLKRLFDIAASFILLILLSPFFFVTGYMDQNGQSGISFLSTGTSNAVWEDISDLQVSNNGNEC